MQLLQIGTLAALAQATLGAYIQIRDTAPPANKYVTHCTAVIEGSLYGCSGSSNPWKNGCGANFGTSTKEICGSAQLTIDWASGHVEFENKEGDRANCTLDKQKAGGQCDTEDPNKYPKIQDSGASELFNVQNALYALGPVAAGLMI